MYSIKIDFNERQAEAVAHNEGPALVLAGAGSGKTRVITGRVVRLISSGVSPSAILCVTFTNKAAGEMRDRIAEASGIDASYLWISTFHSACLRIFRKDFQKLGYTYMPVVFDETDQKSLVKSIIKQMGETDSELPAGKVLSLISRYKNDMKGPEDLASELKRPNAKVIAEVFVRYQEELRKNNAVDFDDLLLEIIRLFHSRPDVLEQYHRQFKYIMVDEFQDTNLVQYSLVRALAGKKGNLFVVGDDDQSIYRWRGARLGNILDFENDFPGCKVIMLEENYRSTGNILEAASVMVKNVYGRKEKRLWTRQEPGDPITVFTASTETGEAEFIVEEMLRKIDSGQAVFGDFAVFYRTNAQSRVIEECLNKHRIPYRIFGGLKFYSRKEVKDVMGYFRLAVNERDEVGFLRAITAPPRGIGPVSLSKLKNFAAAKGISLLEACRGEGNGISGVAEKKLKEFYELIKDIKKMASAVPASQIIEMTLERSGYVNALLEKRTAQDNARVENLKELAGAPHTMETITEFLERTILLSELDLVEENTDYVSLMTLHVSKGLEFPEVFIVGMEENLLPHFNSMNSIEELDEERRLCYVGMTRAKRKLYLIRAITRRIYGQLSINNPSPFLNEILPDIGELKPAVESIAPPVIERLLPSEMQEMNVVDNGKDDFKVGKSVRHRIFGEGVIKKCEGIGKEMKLTVLFRHAGEKRLSCRFVKLCGYLSKNNHRLL